MFAPSQSTPHPPPPTGSYETSFRSQLEQLGEDVDQLAPWLSGDKLFDMYGRALRRSLSQVMLATEVRCAAGVR